MWDELDEELGFAKYQQGKPKTGWLINMIQASRSCVRAPGRVSCLLTARPSQTLVPDDSHSGGRAGVDYYFIQDDGGMFKTTLTHEPYFFIACRVRAPIE